MSIVIVGGHDRMVGQYKKICKSYKCKCKVFTQMEADFGKKIGCAHWTRLALLQILCAAIPAVEMHSTVFSKHVADKYFSCIYCII